MSGEYIVFGLKLCQAGEDGNGWGFTYLDFGTLDGDKVKARYKEVFDIIPEGVIPDPYLFIFSHFH